MADIFVVMEYIECDDHYYGYKESLHSIYNTFGEAKAFLDAYLIENKERNEKYGSPPIQIIQMKIANRERIVVFESPIIRSQSFDD